MKPITQTEAEKFIADQVSALLWKRLTVIFSIIGIANVVALVALFNTITSQAKTIAEEQVRVSAAKYASESLDKFTEVTNAARDRIAKLDGSYAELYTKVGETNADLKSLDTNKKVLDTNLKELSTESQSLSLTLQTLKNSDVTRAAQTLNLISSLPEGDAKAIVTAFTELKPAFETLAQRLTVAEQGIPDTQLKAITARVEAETRKKDADARAAAAAAEEARIRALPDKSNREGGGGVRNR